MTDKIAHGIERFLPISLKEMDAVKLMRRVDTKFVVSKTLLPEILKDLREDYFVLEIDNTRVMTYDTAYYDTANHQFYLDHHNGKSNRLKVRIRQYVESNLFFLEIKQKNAKGITTKTRMPIRDFQKEIPSTFSEFIEKTTSKKLDLLPSLSTKFNRITLVGKKKNERATIDLNLAYSRKLSQKRLENVVIIEVKQDRLNRNSALVRTMRKHRKLPENMSKYCLGMSFLNKKIKYNRFKRKQLKLINITA
jgi:hypothetical protein